MDEVDWNIAPPQNEGAQDQTARFRDMPEVMPLEEEDHVADEHEELHVVRAQRMPHKPSAGEIAVHSVTGRALSSRHIVSDHEYDALACRCWLDISETQMFLCSCSSELKH